jgi:hypothetical protein
MAHLQPLIDFLGFPRGMSVSVCRDLLGFTEGKMPDPVFPFRPKPTISLSNFVRGYAQQHFDVRIIVAGSDMLSQKDRQVIDYAIFRLRDIYSTAGIGIGQVLRQNLTVTNSQGHATVTTQDQIVSTGTDITNDTAFETSTGLLVDGAGTTIPVVMPANMNVRTTNPDGTVTVTSGFSPVPGPCDPRPTGKQRSSVVAIFGEATGRTLAHEVGHFLGCVHPNPPDNSLMTPDADETKLGRDPFNSVGITPDQKNTMLGSCKMLPGLVGIV